MGRRPGEAFTQPNPTPPNMRGYVATTHTLSCSAVPIQEGIGGRAFLSLCAALPLPPSHPRPPDAHDHHPNGICNRHQPFRERNPPPHSPPLTACSGPQGYIGRGGGTLPLSRACSLRPATVFLTPSASFNGICDRQQPPPTALATSSNRLSNRFWGRLRGSIPSNVSLLGPLTPCPIPLRRRCWVKEPHPGAPSGQTPCSVPRDS